MSIPFTLLTSDHCSLAKEFHLAEGKLQSSTIANMASGHAQRAEIPDVSALPLGLAMLKPNQAICCGLSIHGDTPLTTGKHAAATPGLVARTTDYFAWPQGPALFAIDVDVDEGSEYRSVEAVLTALESCSEWLKDALRVACPSSSSYVGTRGLRGVHVYLAVTDGARIPELGKRLQQDQWLAGRGSVKISKSGALLVRQLSDASIYQTQRIMFEAKPVLGDGVTRVIPSGQEWVIRARQIAAGRPPAHAENGMINVGKLAPLKALQLRQVETAIAGAKQRAKTQANRVAFDWHKARAQANGWTEDVAERLATAAIFARDNKQLSGAALINLENHGLVAVSQLVAFWDNYVGESCTAPEDALREDLEPRHFTKGVLTLREGRMGLFSFKDNEFYSFHGVVAPKLDRWMQAALRVEGSIDYPEPMGRGSTPALNVITALDALAREANVPIRYNVATFSAEGLPVTEMAPVWRALSQVGCRGLKEENYKQAVYAVATSNAYDPWRETIDNLPVWDQIPRLDSLLTDVCGAPACEALVRTSQALFSAIVMRQFKPGEMQGVIPVLIGGQGVGKSFRFVKALATALGSPMVPQIEFKEPDRMSRDARSALIAELAEMSGHGRKDAEAVKLWATNNDDIYKDLYDRDSTPHPRRFVLIGTANKHELNNDETGNRRFMPVMVTQPIDANWVLELPQILAEARDRFCMDDTAYGDMVSAATMAVLAHNTADMRVGEGAIHDTIDDLMPGIIGRLSKVGPSITGAAIRTALDMLPSGRQISSRRVGQWLMARGWERRRNGQGYLFDPPLDHISQTSDEPLTQAINPFSDDSASLH